MQGCDWLIWWCWRKWLRRPMLQLWCNNTLCIMDIFFQHRDLHKCMSYRYSLAQRSFFDFFLISANLVQSVLDVQVKRSAELSTDHYPVVFKLHLDRPAGSTQTCKTRISYWKKWGPWWKRIRERLCRQCAFLVLRDPGMHSGRVVATVASSATWVCRRKQIGVAKMAKK